MITNKSTPIESLEYMTSCYLRDKIRGLVNWPLSYLQLTSEQPDIFTNLYKIVVFPAPSKPRISILISLLPNKFLK